MTTLIALIGDYNKNFVAHHAIPQALELARNALNTDVNWQWLETVSLDNVEENLSQFSAIWVVPGSPYANTDAVLKAILFARETNRSFLGTCGGFQHALVEYARNVCNLTDADHAETNPNGTVLVISPLSCSLVEKTGEVFFTPSSRLHAIFGGEPALEGYHCNYGLNAKWRSPFETFGLRFTAFDSAGEVRGCELPTHPFFIGTLFQPERSALRGEQHPLIKAFVKSAIARKR